MTQLFGREPAFSKQFDDFRSPKKMGLHHWDNFSIHKGWPYRNELNVTLHATLSLDEPAPCGNLAADAQKVFWCCDDREFLERLTVDVQLRLQPD